MRKLFLLIFLIIHFETMYAQSGKEELNTIDNKAWQIINQMTLRQKVHEMSGRGINKMGLSFLVTKRIIPVKFGGNKKLGIPSGFFFDGPRGVALYKGATAFPVASARAASWDTELERKIGVAMAEEIIAAGGNYSGAVCVNLLRHPANGRAQESYSEDSFLTGEMGVALVQGIQTLNVQACVKHFALNSMENNRFGGNVIVDEQTLHEVYLPHFKKIVQAGVASVMSAYNKVNGEYCGENGFLLDTILRHDWDFKGYVTSDWQFGLFDTEKGIKAGLNIEMPVAKFYKYNKIKKLIETNKISIAQIDSLIFPVIRTKLLFCGEPTKDNYPKQRLGCSEHVALAKESAEKSIVLLKNENNILPLSDDAKMIAVTGSLVDYKQTGDRGSSRVLPKYVVTLKEALPEYFPGSQVFTIRNNEKVRLYEICNKADAVIVLAGYTFMDEGEYIGMGKIRDSANPDRKNFPVILGMFGLGGDRKYLHFHQSDIDVIKLANSLNKKVIVCLVGGSAITVEEWQADVPAILHTFYSGMEGGNALAEILCGQVNPSGKLPFTVPVSENDLPAFNSYSPEVTYDYFHGYTLFDKTNKPVRFPFGFGLSYTTFKISDLDIDKDTLVENAVIQATVTIKNTGKCKGQEVIQLYVGFENSQFIRPVKLLRAFEKVELKPGETRKVLMKVPLKDLSYFNIENHSWEIEKMKYSIYIGNQSQSKDFLTAQIEVK